MRAGAHQRRHREVQRGLSARRRHRADAAFERGDALLEHRRGRVGDARVDMARAFQIEQRGGIIGVGEDIGGGLVDRHRARAGRRVGLLAGMQAQRVEFRQLGIDHGPVPPSSRGASVFSRTELSPFFGGDRVIHLSAAKEVMRWTV